MEYVKCTTEMENQLLPTILNESYSEYQKSKQSLVRRTINHNANAPIIEFKTKAQITKRPPTSVT